MLLKSIKFKDFRCFRGDISIDLSCTEERNIIAILGDNTRGKSTIVQAFAWCFYGVSNYDNPEQIYNRAIARGLPIFGKTRAMVAVEFEHEGVLYTVRREQEFIKTVNGEMKSSDNRFSMTYIDNLSGETKSCGTAESGTSQIGLANAINKILPEDLAPYFFFAGEKNNELTTKSLSLAVRNLMGIQALINMRDHMRGETKSISSNSVCGYYEKLQADSSNEDAKREWNKKEEAEKNIEIIDKDLKEIDEQIKNYEEKINERNEKLRQAEPTKELQKQREVYMKDLKDEQERLNRSYNEYLSHFSDYAVNLLTIPLLERAKDRLKQMDLSDKGIKGIEAIAIKELLHRGICLCGTDLKEGTVAYKNVEKYLDILPPKSVGILVGELQNSINESKHNGMAYVERSCNIYKNIQFSIQKIHEYERRENEISERLKNIGTMDTKQYELDLIQYKQRLKELQENARRKIAYKQEYISKRDNAHRAYNEYISKSKRNEKYALYYSYSKKILDWINQEYEEKEKHVREMLELSVTDIFNKMYSGRRRVTIDANYNMHVEPKADTGGIKAIQYFSYVGGLVQVTKKVMKERKADELYGEEYPLVLDAAFSHTDARHTKAIAVELSNVTSQLIFAVMDKDWAHVGNEIGTRIAKTYRLVKNNEDEVVIQEV